MVSGQGLWEAYLPGTREGCHSKEEVLHRYRGLHVYSYIGVKRPWDMQRPKVSLFCVLIKWHGNTCRCWKGWKDSVQATQNLPKNHFFYPNPWMCFISDQLHATFKNLTSQNRISIKAMHECASSQALKEEYPGTAHMSHIRYFLRYSISDIPEIFHLTYSSDIPSQISPASCSSSPFLAAGALLPSMVSSFFFRSSFHCWFH